MSSSAVCGRCLIFLVTALTTTLALATPIAINSGTGLFNTGVGATGTTLADGTLDLHYAITASPDGASTETAKTSASGFPIGPWLGDDTASDWIGETAGYPSLNEGAGLFHNDTTFSSPIAGTITITGQWATDDEGPDILLNGVSTVATSGGFGSFFPFSITGSVVAGANTLSFENFNSGGPGGVRVEFTSADVSPVPEPSSLAIFGIGALGLVIARLPRRAYAKSLLQ